MFILLFILNTVALDDDDEGGGWFYVKQYNLKDDGIFEKEKILSRVVAVQAKPNQIKPKQTEAK